MSPALKSLGAAAAAAAMVAGALVGRGALEDKKVRDDLRLTVVCDPLAKAFCEAAAKADPRLTIRTESPEVTTKTLVGLPPGQGPDFQAWVTVGPWLQMADGRRTGTSKVQKDVRYVASSSVVLVTRMDQESFCSKPKQAACLPLARPPTGLPSPRTSGIGLAGLAQVVMASTDISAGELDRGAIESGPAADVIQRLSQNSNPRAGREEVNARFSGANPIIRIQAVAGEFAGAKVLRSEPAVQAVLQIGILDSIATDPLTGEAGGRALASAATSAGWDRVGDETGGLPEPGVLAALQEAWTGP